MLVETLLITICWGAATASYNPPECPAKCECEGPTMKCETGFLPPLDQLDKRLTRFQLRDAEIQIKSLTNNMTVMLDQLVSLQLVSVGLQTIESGALAKISRLEELEISYNDIEMLTAEIFEGCNQLTFLNLESNGIKVIENDTFSSLPSLKNLKLFNNSIISLTQTFPSSLQKLNLESNQIEMIKNLAFSEMTSLNLCDNPVTKIDPDEVKMQKLQDLCLGGPKFTMDPSVINIEKFPILGNLKIAGSDKAALNINSMALANILSMASQSLNNLTLEACSLPNTDIFTMPNSTLKSLKVVNVTVIMKRVPRDKIALGSIEIFDLSGSPGLARLFINTPSRVSVPELQILRLSRCDIKDFPEHIFKSKTPNVTELDISHNPLDCTCTGLSWIQKYVRNGQLKLSKEEDTLCATPSHFKDIPLLTATLCPVLPTESVTILTTIPLSTQGISTSDAVTENATIPVGIPETTLSEAITHNTTIIPSNNLTSLMPDSVSKDTTTISTSASHSPITNATTSLKTKTTILPTTFNQTPSETSLLTSLSTPKATFLTFASTAIPITDVSNFQRSGSGVNDENNTEIPPALTAPGTKVLNFVGGLAVMLIVVILVAIVVAVHYQKRQSMTITRERNVRARNIISMSELSKSREQLLA